MALTKQNKQNQIVIYQTEDGQTQIDVRLEKETVWLSTSQMALLFNREESNIRRHIINVFKEEELPKDNNVHFLHVNGVKKPVPFYTLDVIISVGYRVKSKCGVQFRQWANRVLKEYLIKGYAVNERLRHEQIGELRQLVDVLGRTIQNQSVLQTAESGALFEVVTDYAYALDTLDNYDYERLTIDKTTKEEPFHATYENAMEDIHCLREKFGGSALFGNEKDEKGNLILNPNSSEQVLREQIEAWLKDSQAKQTLLEKSIPQKGLEYVIERTGTALDTYLVLVGCLRSKSHRDWVLTNGKYNIRLDMGNDAIDGAIKATRDFMNVSHVLLYNEEAKMIDHFFDVHDPINEMPETYGYIKLKELAYPFNVSRNPQTTYEQRRNTGKGHTLYII